jgi:hypothetical protein
VVGQYWYLSSRPPIARQALYHLSYSASPLMCSLHVSFYLILTTAPWSSIILISRWPVGILRHIKEWMTQCHGLGHGRARMTSLSAWLHGAGSPPPPCPTAQKGRVDATSQVNRPLWELLPPERLNSSLPFCMMQITSLRHLSPAPLFIQSTNLFQ